MITFDKKIEEKLETFFKEYQETGKDVFPLDDESFKGVNVYINKKPNLNPMPAGTINEIPLYFGGEE